MCAIAVCPRSPPSTRTRCGGRCRVRGGVVGISGNADEPDGIEFIDTRGSPIPLADAGQLQHHELVVGLAILGALLVGGVIGVALNRWRPTGLGHPTKRLEDSDNVDVQAGFRNMQGGQT